MRVLYQTAVIGVCLTSLVMIGNAAGVPIDKDGVVKRNYIIFYNGKNHLDAFKSIPRGDKIEAVRRL